MFWTRNEKSERLLIIQNIFFHVMLDQCCDIKTMVVAPAQVRFPRFIQSSVLTDILHILII